MPKRSWVQEDIDLFMGLLDTSPDLQAFALDFNELAVNKRTMGALYAKFTHLRSDGLITRAHRLYPQFRKDATERQREEYKVRTEKKALHDRQIEERVRAEERSRAIVTSSPPVGFPGGMGATKFGHLGTAVATARKVNRIETFQAVRAGKMTLKEALDLLRE